MRRSAPRTNPSPQHRPHDCAETSSSPGPEAPHSRHILSDAGLPNIDAELEQFAMNARRTPQRVGNAHLSDQLPNFSRHAGATLSAPRLPAPVTPKTSAMPSHHGVGPNDGECLAGFRKQLADPTQHHSVDSPEMAHDWACPVAAR